MAPTTDDVSDIENTSGRMHSPKPKIRFVSGESCDASSKTIYHYHKEKKYNSMDNNQNYWKC
jgi:hypothetical protein